jgi:hypothetical protein
LLQADKQKRLIHVTGCLCFGHANTGAVAKYWHRPRLLAGLPHNTHPGLSDLCTGIFLQTCSLSAGYCHLLPPLLLPLQPLLLLLQCFLLLLLWLVPLFLLLLLGMVLLMYLLLVLLLLLTPLAGKRAEPRCSPRVLDE